MCYSDDVGLIPFCFKKGLEAIPPVHEHPVLPILILPKELHLGRNPTPTPPPSCHPFAVLGVNLHTLIASGCAATSREKAASRLLLRGKETFHSQAPSLHGGPRGSQDSPRRLQPGEARRGPESRHTSRSAAVWAPQLLTRLKKQEGETAYSN